MFGVEPVVHVIAGLATAALIDMKCALPDTFLRSGELRRR